MELICLVGSNSLLERMSPLSADIRPHSFPVNHVAECAALFLYCQPVYAERQSTSLLPLTQHRRTTPTAMSSLFGMVLQHVIFVAELVTASGTLRNPLSSPAFESAVGMDRPATAQHGRCCR